MSLEVSYEAADHCEGSPPKKDPPGCSSASQSLKSQAMLSCCHGIQFSDVFSAVVFLAVKKKELQESPFRTLKDNLINDNPSILSKDISKSDRKFTQFLMECILYIGSLWKPVFFCMQNLQPQSCPTFFRQVLVSMDPPLEVAVLVQSKWSCQAWMPFRNGQFIQWF